MDPARSALSISLMCTSVSKNATHLYCNHTIPANNTTAANPTHPAHTCPKPGHSCMRNIISFKKLPGRAAFKRIGRVFMQCVSTATPGYGLRDLSKAKPTIERGIKKQLVRTGGPTTGCVRCGTFLATPTVYTADVGQAYEIVDPGRVERAFRIIFKSIQTITGKADPTPSCIHYQKAKTTFGGWVRDKLSDRSVYHLSKVSHCKRSLVKLRFYRFGNLFLHEVSGIPIGGLVSGAVLKAVLSVDEHYFESFGWSTFADSCNRTGTMEEWPSIFPQTVSHKR